MRIGSMTGGGAPTAQMIQQMQQGMFQKLDANTDGGIDKTELSKFAQDNGLDTSRVDEMFQAADSDGSGSISEKENAAVMEKIGERMKTMFAQGSPAGVSGTGSGSDSTDVLMDMMNSIREHSHQRGGTDAMRQLLEHLNQQAGSYTQQGTASKTSTSVLLTQLA